MGKELKNWLLLGAGVGLPRRSRDGVPLVHDESGTGVSDLLPCLVGETIGAPASVLRKWFKLRTAKDLWLDHRDAVPVAVSVARATNRHEEQDGVLGGCGDSDFSADSTSSQIERDRLAVDDDLLLAATFLLGYAVKEREAHDCHEKEQEDPAERGHLRPLRLVEVVGAPGDQCHGQVLHCPGIPLVARFEAPQPRVPLSRHRCGPEEVRDGHECNGGYDPDPRDWLLGLILLGFDGLARHLLVLHCLVMPKHAINDRHDQSYWSQ